MKRTVFRSVFLFSTLIAIVVMSGCSSSSSPSSSGGSGNSEPNAGSTFTYTYTTVDTNGVTSAPSDSTYTIISDSLNYGGKTNVVGVQDAQGGISYYHIESNGDLSIYVDLSTLFPIPVPLTTNWFVIPIASDSEQKILLFDSTIEFPLNGANTPVEISVQTDATDLGSWNVSADNTSFSSEKGSIVVSASASASVLGVSVPVASYTQTSTIWYSKQLKYYSERQDQDVTGGALLGTPTTTSDTYLLKSYTEK